MILYPLYVMSTFVRITERIVFLVSRAVRMQARVTARVRSHRAADSPSQGSPSPSRDSPRLNYPRYAIPPFPDRNHKAVLRIRIRIRIFWGLLDLDPDP
jgi:hypothetical protein